jgi:hypothetical protein
LDYSTFSPQSSKQKGRENDEEKTTNPMQQDEEHDIEPQRVFTKKTQPTEPSWSAMGAERMERIEQGRRDPACAGSKDPQHSLVVAAELKVCEKIIVTSVAEILYHPACERPSRGTQSADNVVPRSK